MGLITNIQDYTVHDGYGLRSLVFFKGCPLKCEWCQNPEMWSTDVDIMFHNRLCTECWECLKVCSEGSIRQDNERIDRSSCTKCMKCVDSCPSHALSRVGVDLSVEQVLKVILNYKPFYDNSNGGVTFSGGEALFQPDFLIKMLKRCKEEGVHTAVETCGFVDYKILKEAANYIDLILFDIKHMDDKLHKKGTGFSNKLILENLEKIAKESVHPEIVIRIPLIPDFNDDDENIVNTAKFLRTLQLKRVDLLPFNELPANKFKALGIKWIYEKVKMQKEERLVYLKELLESYEITVTIGGLW